MDSVESMSSTTNQEDEVIIVDPCESRKRALSPSTPDSGTEKRLDSRGSPDGLIPEIQEDGGGAWLQQKSKKKNKQKSQAVENPASQLGKNPSDSEKGSPGSKFTFVVKSEKVLRIPVCDGWVRKILGPEASIKNSSLAAGGKVARYKTKSSASHSHIEDLNRMLKHQDELRKIAGDPTLTVEHYDPTSKAPYAPPHAIVSGVPLEFDDMEELRSLILEEEPSLKDRVLSCHRIMGRDSGKDTRMVRLVCVDRAAAEEVIKNGVKAGPRFFRCQAPRTQEAPDRCFRCQQTGHVASRCKAEKQVCAKCGEDHRTKLCERPRADWRCPSCGENHAAWAPFCRENEKVLSEKKKAEEERRKTLPSSQPVTQGTMASITNVWSQRQAQSSAEVKAKVLEASSHLETKVATLKEASSKEIASLRGELRGFQQETNAKLDAVCSQLATLAKGVESILARVHTPSPAVTTPTHGGKPSEQMKSLERVAKQNADLLKTLSMESGGRDQKLLQHLQDTQVLCNTTNSALAQVRRNVDTLRDSFRSDLAGLDQRIEGVKKCSAEAAERAIAGMVLGLQSEVTSHDRSAPRSDTRPSRPSERQIRPGGSTMQPPDPVSGRTLDPRSVSKTRSMSVNSGQRSLGSKSTGSLGGQ